MKSLMTTMLLACWMVLTGHLQGVMARASMVQTAIVVSGPAQLYMGPSLDSANIIATLRDGTYVTILDHLGTDAHGRAWFYVALQNGQRGWLPAWNVQVIATTFTEPGATTPSTSLSGTAFVITNPYAPLYASPGPHSAENIMMNVPNATQVRVLWRLGNDGPGRSWVRVRLPSGAEGWMYAGDLAVWDDMPSRSSSRENATALGIAKAQEPVFRDLYWGAPPSALGRARLFNSRQDSTLGLLASYIEDRPTSEWGMPIDSIMYFFIQNKLVGISLFIGEENIPFARALLAERYGAPARDAVNQVEWRLNGTTITLKERMSSSGDRYGVISLDAPSSVWMSSGERRESLSAARVWSGSGSRTTESFYVSTSEWRIRWTARDDQGGPASVFITVYQPGGQFVTSASGRSAGQTMETVVHHGPGRYYLEIDAGSWVQWRVWVEEM